jgi:hypothetical protein
MLKRITFFITIIFITLGCNKDDNSANNSQQNTSLYGYNSTMTIVYKGKTFQLQLTENCLLTPDVGVCDDATIIGLSKDGISIDLGFPEFNPAISMSLPDSGYITGRNISQTYCPGSWPETLELQIANLDVNGTTYRAPISSATLDNDNFNKILSITRLYDIRCGSPYSYLVYPNVLKVQGEFKSRMVNQSTGEIQSDFMTGSYELYIGYY